MTTVEHDGIKVTIKTLNEIFIEVWRNTYWKMLPTVDISMRHDFNMFPDNSKLPDLTIRYYPMFIPPELHVIIKGKKHIIKK